MDDLTNTPGNQSWPAHWHEFPAIAERSAVEISTFITSDGALLRVCQASAPARECCIVIVPPMVSILIALPTISLLARHIPVLAWEPRGLADPTPSFDVASHYLGAYAQDVEEIAAAWHIEVVHLVTWCIAAEVAFEVVRRRRVNVGSVALVTPILDGEPLLKVPQSPLRAVLDRMLSSLLDVSDAEAAALLKRMQRVLSLNESQDPVESLTQRITRMNFTTLERVRNSLLVGRALNTEVRADDMRTRFRELYHTVPTHLICFADDDVVGCPANLDRLQHENLTCDLHASGGHAAVFKVPDIVSSSLLGFYHKRGVLAAE